MLKSRVSSEKTGSPTALSSGIYFLSHSLLLSFTSQQFPWLLPSTSLKGMASDTYPCIRGHCNHVQTSADELSTYLSIFSAKLLSLVSIQHPRRGSSQSTGLSVLFDFLSPMSSSSVSPYAHTLTLYHHICTSPGMSIVNISENTVTITSLLPSHPHSGTRILAALTSLRPLPLSQIHHPRR